jgi:hypothetical protein
LKKPLTTATKVLAYLTWKAEALPDSAEEYFHCK